ncbi:hypothetical protein [Pseudotabrizicola algicola]|uniref:Uncharacterized protein n=1 Tax=Pseudotabrizicola algicola TaxID=2709381 RepID=A0A6B3RJY8_9RHOB|nr:hypothetical protein [Pseudotabrizicola algicola]NEX45208.1 hypothetical protein [Pseudotabrizicola algicola]
MHCNINADAQADARATIDVTTSTDPDIRKIRNAWAALKAARGQDVRPALLAPAHIIDPPAPQLTADPPALRELTAADIQSRALEPTRAYIQRLRAARNDLGGAA